MTLESTVGKHGIGPTIVVARGAIIATHSGASHRLTAHVLLAHHGPSHAWSIHLRSHWPIHAGAHAVAQGIAVDASAIYWSVIHILATHTIVADRVVIHAIVKGGAHWTHVSGANMLRSITVLAHAIDRRPKALFQPADLTEDLLAPMHLFLAITRCVVIGKLIDKRTCGIYEFIECRRRPVGDQGLVKSHDMVVITGCR